MTETRTKYNFYFLKLASSVIITQCCLLCDIINFRQFAYLTHGLDKLIIAFCNFVTVILFIDGLYLRFKCIIKTMSQLQYFTGTNILILIVITILFLLLKMHLINCSYYRLAFFLCWIQGSQLGQIFCLLFRQHAFHHNYIVRRIFSDSCVVKGAALHNIEGAVCST